MAQTVTWTGSSGTKYQYTVYPTNTDWNDVGGNYIFAYQLSTGNWRAVYVGQTNSFKNRIPNHPEWPCAARNGATHVLAHVNGTERARLVEEADLIAALQPPCNQQGR